MNYQIFKVQKFNLIFLLITLFISCADSNDDDEIYAKMEINTDYIQLELEVLDLVNKHRNSNGLTPLKRLNSISMVAESHSKYMAKTGIVSHENFPKRSQELMDSINAKSIGENIGFGFGTAEGILKAWLKSDSHKKIIENPTYTHFGISIKQNNEMRNYFTNIFIRQ